jgi:hypothetical protein
MTLHHFLVLLLHELLSFFSMILPNDAENCIRIIRCDGRSNFLALDSDLDKLLLAVSVAIVREPVVEMLAT